MQLPFNKNNQGTTEIASFATWTSTHDYSILKEDLLLSMRWLLNIVDKTTLQKAVDHYFSDYYHYVEPEPQDPPVDPEVPEYDWDLFDALVEHIQRVLVRHAYTRNIAESSVIQDNTGIKVVWSEDFRPAQAETIENLRINHVEKAYEFLDMLIEFLDENPAIFPEFQVSVQNLNLKTLFVNSKTDFCNYFNIKTTSYFYEIVDTIRRMQIEEVKPALGLAWYLEVQKYQERRIELEACQTEIATLDDFPTDPAPESGDLTLVISEVAYYKHTGTQWTIYVKDCRPLLQYIKPALVYLTMSNKFLSDISNLNPKWKQIELLRANANELKARAKAILEQIVNHIKEAEAETEEEQEELIAAKTEPRIYVSNNSLML